MKIRKIVVLLLSSLSVCLYAYEGHDKDPQYEWFERDEVAVAEDGIYVDSNKGMLKLNVVEFDRTNNRYKVLCNCLEEGKDPTDALCAPIEDTCEFRN